MICPRFYNNNKNCAYILNDIVDIIDEKLCTSENGYTDCIFYKMLNQPKEKQCRYMEVCSHIASVTLRNLDYDKIKSECETYCLSENNQLNCAIYKLMDDLKTVPIGLLPSGEIILPEIK